MSPRRLLVVAASPVLEEHALREAVRQHAGGEEPEVHVVSPAPPTSWLQRLTGDVDKARAEAEDAARQAAEAVEGIASVDAEVGDPDLSQAIDDALRRFPADELIVVSPPSAEAGRLDESGARESLERFGLPVTYISVSGP